MHIFYTPDIKANASEYVLSPEESKHAIRVLRMREKQEVTLVDGRGGLYNAEIEMSDIKATVLHIHSSQFEYGKPSYNLHIAIAPTKNIDRIEWFVEKATEIGVSEITPLICAQSERKKLNIERLERIAIAAMKQSQKAFLPIINSPVNFKDFILASDNITDCFKGIAHCEEGQTKKIINKDVKPGTNALLLIGPEGDFSQKEINLALIKGYQAITLGESRLRTETAGVVCCVEMALLNSQ